MPKKTFHTYNDTEWARCPCGWTGAGGDCGRGAKKLAKRLHAKNCEIYAWCLEHPELFAHDVMTYQGGGDPQGRLDLGNNTNGNGLQLGDLLNRVDASARELDVPLPTAEDIDERKRREKKAQENRKKRLAKKRAKAKRDAEKQAENEPSAE